MDVNAANANSLQGLDGVASNGIYSDEMATNGTDGLRQPAADPMTMSGLFSRDLDPQSEGDTETSTSNLSHSDAFGGCGMTDSFIQQDELPAPGEQDDDFAPLDEQQQQDDMLGGCGMTDSFMQLTNGSSVTGAESQNDAVLIDFGQTNATTTSSSTSNDAIEDGLGSQAAMFGEDFGHSQEGLNKGYEDADEEDSDSYHPGQPAVSTNPFVADEPAETETTAPTSSSHPAMPAGIDLLIQSAPPPSHPFAEDDREPGYNPFTDEEVGSTQVEVVDTSPTNPFAPPQPVEPSRLSEQQAEDAETEEQEGDAEEDEGDAGEEEEEEGDSQDEVARLDKHDFDEKKGAMMEADFLPVQQECEPPQRYESTSEQVEEEESQPDLGVSAAPSAPRGSEMEETISRSEVVEEKIEADHEASLVEVHPPFQVLSSSAPDQPEPQPEPEPPQTKEEPPKPVAAVVPQPTPQPQIQESEPEVDKKKPADTIATKSAIKSPRKTPSSPAKSGVPVKASTPTTRQRQTPTSLSTTTSRPASARTPKKEEPTTKPTSKPTTPSRPRTAPSSRTPKAHSRPKDKTATPSNNGLKNETSKPPPKLPATTRTQAVAKPSPAKTLATPTPKSSAAPRAAGSSRTPTGSASPASSTSGSASFPRKMEAKSKIGSLDNASHAPGGGNVKITSKKPDLANVSSKIGSKDKIDYKPGGGNVKIENKKLELANVKSRVGSLDNAKHTPRGGDKKIESQKLEWKVSSKIGSLDNARHTPGGGDKKIESKKLDWKVQSKIGSLDNAKHVAGGGDKKIEQRKLDWKAQSKVGSLDNAQHIPGGGGKKIETQKLDFKEKAASKVGSLDSAQPVTGGGDKPVAT